jgi:hypothetical protein
MLLGALVVSIAYARGRSGAPGGTALYWCGQALVVLPAAWRVLAPATALCERLGLLTGSAAIQSLLTWCYSPDQFRFPDELQHLRTAGDVLRTGHLFTPSSTLPVSPGFPGLEVVSTALQNLTGLSIFHAGVLTASVAHTVLPVCVFLLLRELIRSPRVAAVGALVYGTSPHYAFFGTLYAYGTIALPFLVLTLRAAVRARPRSWSVAWIAPPFAAALVSHHLTTLVTLGVLAALTGAALLSSSDFRRGVRLLLGTVLTTVAAVAWTAAAAPATFSYLATPITDVLGGFTGSTGPSPQSLSRTAPLWESVVSLAGAAATSVLILYGVVRLWRSNVSRTVLAFGLLGLAYPATLVVRVVVPHGAELAARALTYVMLLAAFPAAVALARWWNGRGPRRAVAAFGVVVLLSAGAITAGLPPSWARLPGTYHVASFQSGVDSRVEAVGRWAARRLPPGQQAACDFSVCSIVGAYARANLSSAASEMFYAPSIESTRAQLARLNLDYVFLDRRMSLEVPINGQYMFRDVQEGRHRRPYDPALFRKFDEDQRIDRVYDNGPIQAYFVRRTWNG